MENEREQLRAILESVGENPTDEYLDNLISRSHYIETLVSDVRDALAEAKLAAVQALLRHGEHYPEYYIKFCGWDTPKRKDRLYALLASKFADRLEFVKETKSTAGYRVIWG